MLFYKCKQIAGLVNRDDLMNKISVNKYLINKQFDNPDICK